MPAAPRRPAGRGLRSRIVAWLRVLLPLVALAMLATLFMWQSRPDIESTIPFASGDDDALTGPPRIAAPQWAGVTEDGAEVVLSADTATPRKDEDASAEAIRLDWLGPGGTHAQATAPAAAMGADEITLTGGVWVELSSGWSLESNRLSASRTRSEVIAQGDVTVTAPFGTVTAQSARLYRPQDPDEPTENAGNDAGSGEVLVFTGDVRLLYQP